MAQLDELFDRVVTVGNAKGGVFKTTVVSNVGALLAAPDYPVLIVDLDPQGNIARDLGYIDTPNDDKGRELTMALLESGSSDGTPVKPLKNVRPGLDVLMGGKWLHRVTPWLGQNPDLAKVSLREVLRPIADQYELILVDLPPGDLSLRMAALGASRWVLAPTKSDSASIQGVTETVESMNEISVPGGANESVELIGVLLVDSTVAGTQIKRTARLQLRRQLQIEGEEMPELFDSAIRHLEKVAQESRERGQLYHELEKEAALQPRWWEVLNRSKSATSHIPDSASSAASDVKSVARELVTRITEAEQGTAGEVMSDE
ncbi:ParA family protein [Leucobacter sp. cx-169]|uniref:ParA family protein n=1 Tax=Leucobacter sp. cx-169 TaxID=2770549 RepID=UPI00165DEE21|nr:ParA family protein [Leucobacter sp. cx-169]MBC9927326.1 ParA family protein [Leucobacter sp. cx-169]